MTLSDEQTMMILGVITGMAITIFVGQYIINWIHNPSKEDLRK